MIRVYEFSLVIVCGVRAAPPTRDNERKLRGEEYELLVCRIRSVGESGPTEGT